ncbi:beta-phosphoglucomutase family hydrolase [Bacteroidales bacterium OttesenSCG-928-K03]|nr:beta-phosphoglucomutase family hydrolase [Bacteroidales bacterium OttesenSCG-928-L14]MDL2242937.1 beta-phosphoglucomutase family hydrolase [Bacteroidales bacterium OttesenSCG-928-K03]
MSLSFDAVIFDLDGVITKTSIAHKAAWKQMFDNFLANQKGKHKEFSNEDYVKFVDGKTRYQGVEDFLKSRSINLDFGSPNDEPNSNSICALGNLKNKLFNEYIDKNGVEIYESTIDFIKELKKKKIKIGVASSSKNCRKILEKTNLTSLFDTCVDGTDIQNSRLKGKPEPDIFIHAADNLECAYYKTVIIEDAISGIEAGVKGNFGLIIGLARENNLRELEISGADIAVEDICEIDIEEINDWYKYGLIADGWYITYKDYNPSLEKTRETLLTTGNGYFATRGNMNECSADNNNYPGTYMAGLYNRLKSKIAGKIIENEDFVNCPNWTVFKFKIDNGDWIDINDCEILFIERNLNLFSGELSRLMLVKDKIGREHLIESYRIVSMHDYHLAAEKYIFSPINYSGKITISTGIDGNIINAGVDRYKELNQKHLKKKSASIEDNIIFLETQTTNSKIDILEAAKIITDNKRNKKVIKGASAFIELSFNLKSNDKVEVQKVVAIYNSINDNDLIKKAKKKLSTNVSYESVLQKSKSAWKKIWDEVDLTIGGDRLAQKLTRLHTYHLIVSFSPHNKDFDASIPARGLHGEAYRGHIFWDELYILPFYCIHYPESAKAMLMYRYRRLDEARKYAANNGYKGAMFPWQSGSSGREESQVIHLNPISGKWDEEHSALQRHVSLAVAANIYQYHHITCDDSFLFNYGLEMFWAICRFWASIAKWNEKEQRYSIAGVMGPDEFHEKTPDSQEYGLKDNAYTNILCSWILNIGANYYEDFFDETSATINKIKLDKKEIDDWRNIAGKLNIVIEHDIISQFDGYSKLKELDWDAYEEKYGDIHRLDRILKAEGLSPNDYKISKQADTLMAFYILSQQEVNSILRFMGYNLNNHYIRKNFEYYFFRTSHGSSLSKVVHAHLAGKLNYNKLSSSLYHEALICDYLDTQGGTTAEGIHAGVMSGTILLSLFSYGGLNITGNEVEFDFTKFPEHWTDFSGKIKFRGKTISFNMNGLKVEN